MSDKTISQKAKEALTPILTAYGILLLDGLVSDGILSVKDESDKRIYRLSVETPLEQNVTIPLDQDDALISSFDLFKDVLKNVYNHLQYGETDKRRLTEIIEAFEMRDVFKMPGLNIARIKDLLDNGKSLLAHKEIQKDAIKLFTEHQINFSAYISQLLEFYTLQKGRETFKNFSIERPRSRQNTAAIDLIAKNETPESNFDLLFEIKFRKRPMDTLQEDIVQAFDHLSQYNDQTRKNNWVVIVMYSDEGTSALDRIGYKFKQLKDDLFRDNDPRILLATVYVGNLHFIGEEFKKILETIVSTRKSTTEFRFFNQPVQKGSPIIDDHHYERLLNLDNSDFQISLVPQSKIEHWRVGLKFSSSQIFPDRMTRHGPQYPIFHLEKNNENSTLLISYYDETGKHVFAKPTRFTNYFNQPILLVVSKDQNIVKIDVKNANDESVLDAPHQLSKYSFARLFAWGDNRNVFEIRAFIEEIKK
jgi:hypothetical protein